MRGVMCITWLLLTFPMEGGHSENKSYLATRIQRVIAFIIISAVFIICSYIHLLKYDAWWIRDFDFVHPQLAVIVSVVRMV